MTMTGLSANTPIVGIVGAGVTGRAAGAAAVRLGLRPAWFDLAHPTAVRAARLFGGVVVDSVDDLAVADVVVLAAPGAMVPHATRLVRSGVHVVSLGDDLDEIADLLRLGEGVTTGPSVVVGAGVSPGLSGLLASYAAARLHVVDEIHVAMHGTGGPACARQHHAALGGSANGWHDGEWLTQPGGSGRELCWFPEPVGPADCYRAALADPTLLHKAFPDVERLSARVSATRRDRMTARLPMLSPPHRDGDRGAVRVEVRGAIEGGARVTHLLGAVGLTGDLAGIVAATFASACVHGRTTPGTVVAGKDRELATWLLDTAVGLGLTLHEYNGVARTVAT